MKIKMMSVVLLAGAAYGADYPYRAAELTSVRVTGGFWLPRVETNRQVTLRTCFDKCNETPRIANFTNAANRAWGSFGGIPFDDSDVFKVIEGAAYVLALHPDPKLEAYVDGLIGEIARAQEPDGYLYTARTLGFRCKNKKTGRPEAGMMGPTRWSNCASSHELYNVGHMYEAAVAWFETTGKRNFLDVAIRNADLVDRTFGPGKTQLKDVPGHEEIELALVKLYRVTGERRYLDLAKHFVDQRGEDPSDRKTMNVFTTEGTLEASAEMSAPGAYCQKHRPFVRQSEAVGHAVRAAYLYCGAADIAALTGERAYVDAISRIWENVVSRKLHLNGGIGARRKGEAFGADYELPNDTAYLETCAAIGNALWNERLFLTFGEAKYVDVLERVIYNGFLSGVSLGGDEFFYPNPLASKGGYARSRWFSCSCCPVNDVRFVPQIARFAYATRENAAYVNLFVESDVTLKLAGGDVSLVQKTEYPWKGASAIRVRPTRDGMRFALHVRVPGWCVGKPVPSDLYAQTSLGSLRDFAVRVNGKPHDFSPEKGYCVVDRTWRNGDEVAVSMNMPVRRIKAHEAVEADRGRLAVERGPILYCAEAVDNGGHAFDLAIPADATFAETKVDVLGNVYPALDADGVRLIPYFAWCHRGAGEMQTWFPAVSGCLCQRPDEAELWSSEWAEVTMQNGVLDDYYPQRAEASGCSFRFRLMRYSEAIGVEAYVRDDRIVVDDCQPGQISCPTWKDDCLEVFFDGDDDRNPNTRGPDYNTAPWSCNAGGEYAICPNGASQSDYASAKKCFGTLWGGDVEPWLEQGRRIGTHYRLWFRYACLNRPVPRLDEAVRFGFTICIHDDDDGGENDYALYWKGNPKHPFADESAFGQIGMPPVRVAVHVPESSTTTSTMQSQARKERK